MTTDNILNQEDADRFLRRIGLRVGKDIILKVVAVLTESNKSLYDLYAQGNKRNGSTRLPVCGKGTAYKIKRLYEGGKLGHYLSYLRYEVLIPGLDNLIASYEKKKTLADVRRELQYFLSDWESELSLPLNYLDNADLSRGKKGVPHAITGLVIKWEVSADGEIVRRFSVEERDEFKEIQQIMPCYGRLWTNFKECQKLGGVIIKACNQLGIDIRKQSEIRAGFKIVSSFECAPKKWGLDRFFAWTVYADALGIFTEKWLERSYSFDDRGDDLCEIRWGDSRLAIVKPDAKDAVVDAHCKLRATYKESPMVKEILQWKLLLDAAETQVREELERIQQVVVLKMLRLTDKGTP